MRPRSHRGGFARADLAAAALATALLVAVGVPALAGMGGSAAIQQSMSNLTVLNLAHVIYAADWGGRQVTWTRDDFGEYEDMEDYNAGYDAPVSSTRSATRRYSPAGG